MAMIKCSTCGKDISDKAAACPQCGTPVVPAVPEVMAILCEECGSEIPAGSSACPNCGCPVASGDAAPFDAPQKVEVTGVNLPKMNRNTKKYVLIAVIAAAVILVGCLVGSIISKQNEAKRAEEAKAQYADNMELASYTMLLGAIEAEDAGNLIKQVWYNAIYEERDSKTDKYTRPNGYFVDDFNVALSNLFVDSDFRDTISSIKSNQETVTSLMKELKNPPEEYEEAYEALKELYDAYTRLTNLVINPSGSLTTFSENFNNADSDTANCYDAMKLYID